LEAHPGGYVGPSAGTGHLAVLGPPLGGASPDRSGHPTWLRRRPASPAQAADEVRASDQISRPPRPSGWRSLRRCCCGRIRWLS